jgi:thioredoxin reductase (NADPH)
MAEVEEIAIYGTTWCPDCRRAKQFLRDQRIPFRWVDIEHDAEGLAVVERVNAGKHIIPTIVFPDGSLLVEPTNAELARTLGIKQRAKRTAYELIIIGGGPAGLTAALYAAREGLSTLVIERSQLGGQAATTERLDNFPGFPEGITGMEFAARLTQQAERFGVELLRATNVTDIVPRGDDRDVVTESGEVYCARAVVLATGSTYRRLGVPGEDDFIGAGVHFCATCDGPLYRGQELLVIGGGNSAVEEGVFLTQFSPKVTIVVRGETLSASKIVADRALRDPKIAVLFQTVVREFRGDGRLRSVVLRDLRTGEEREVTPGGVFVFVGLSPNSEVARGTLDVDAHGFVVTNEQLQTSVPGIFAAGDVRHGATAQVASAVGEGAAVTLMVRAYLRRLGDAREQLVTTSAGPDARSASPTM